MFVIMLCVFRSRQSLAFRAANNFLKRHSPLIFTVDFLLHYQNLLMLKLSLKLGNCFPFFLIITQQEKIVKQNCRHLKFKW